MKDVITVAKFTMRDLVNRKAFRVSTIIIMILIVLGFNIPNAISIFDDGKSHDSVLIVDRANLFENKIPQYDGILITQDDDAEIERKVGEGEVQSAIVVLGTTENGSPHLHYVTKHFSTAQEVPQAIFQVLFDAYSELQMEKFGLTKDEISKIRPNYQITTAQVDDQEIGGDITVMMFVAVLLFFAIYFCAFQVSSSITVEKTSKIIETLVTSTSPRSIILGKTIGIGLVGLMQMLLFVITAIISAKLFLHPAILNQMFDLSNFTPFLAIITLVYFILGYFAYALLYALTGSTVAKPEDIQAANTPVAIITMIGFYLAYLPLIDPTGDLNILASLLPISSPFCMPIRVMMGLASVWDVVLSIAILLVFCFIVAKIAIKIYSSAILNYGTRMTIKDMIKTYKEK